MSAQQLTHQNQDAEESILSAMLFQPEHIPAITDGLNEAEFHHPGHRLIFRHLLTMAGEGVSIQLPTITSRMAQAGDLDRIGGAPTLTHLAGLLASSGVVRECRVILRDQWLKREASQLMAASISEMGSADAQSQIAATAEALQSLGAQSTASKHRSMKQLVTAAIERYELAGQLQGKLAGISTGFPLLDSLTGGLCPGHLWAVGGGTSDGKSAYVEQIILMVGMAGDPCAIYTLEMSDDENVDRFFGQYARIPSESFMRGTFNPEEARSFARAATKLSTAPIHVRDVSGIKQTELLADMRLLWRVHKIKVFAIDYGQLIASDGKHFSREREVAALSAALKAFAKQTKSTVIFISQLNEDGKLRESRAIGFDADKAMRLRVPLKDGEDEELDDSRRILHLDKNRGGQRFKKIEYDFDGPTFSFINEREPKS